MGVSKNMPKKMKLEEVTIANLKIDDEYDTIKDTTVVEASKKIKEKNIPDLVVIDDNEKVLGTISTYDIVTKIVAESKSLETRVSEIMMKVKPFSLETKVVEAFDIMKIEQVEVVPVTDENKKLLGVVTVMDVYSALEAFS
jgi:CBS domain-containing protein